MGVEESNKVYSHWRALKMQAEAQAAIRSAQARVGLVQRSDLEAELTRLLARPRE